MIRLLRNAQKVEDAQRNEAIAAAPVQAPIFILGLPRSGTTFLHSLLAADHDNQVPRNWQTIYPGQRPKRSWRCILMRVSWWCTATRSPCWARSRI